MSAEATNRNTEDLSAVKRALLEIRELRAQVASLQASQAALVEPVAIVGLGVRLPGGVTDAGTLWRVLRDGEDTIREVPADRWDAERLYDADPDRPGTMWTRSGGFLDAIDRFDAAFFGISPREAARMDPQQRLVLEVACEALEDAGVAPDRLAGSRTGAFMGVGNTDYFRLLFSRREAIDAYAGSGGSASVVAGRLAYQLGLQGPAMAVDTACSASLVAVHLACQSLRRGECDLALAGGVNLIVGPEGHIAFTKARMIAPDGRCKTFDAAADGYGRGEGAAVIALRRLSDASARGDRILALVRGSAVNQDGRSGGLTAPNGPAQVQVIRQALHDAQLTPSDIDYVEAHGTGTPLGDPIELQAIAEALGEGRDTAQPVFVGSCKTNFGHLEAAAGIAGLVKVVASFGHRAIPPHLHFSRPNPLVDWSGLPLRVPTALQDWPDHGRPMRAGVSSFGFSGTNVHVVLEQAPAPVPFERPAIDRPRHVLALSAATDVALRDLASRYVDRLEAGAGDVDVADLCWSANTGRAHLARRLAVSASDVAGLQRGLAAFIASETAPNLRSSGDATNLAPSIGMLFTGQGAQYVQMARRLDETSPTFRATLDECAAVLDPLLPGPLRSVLFPGDAASGGGGDGAAASGSSGSAPIVLPGDSDSGTDSEAHALDQTAFAQPALFAVEVALYTLWRSWGITPALVLGHSLGELTAACAAGVIALPAALRMVAARARLMQSADAGGSMATLFATREQLAPVLAAHPVETAAFNGPEQIVLTGPAAAVDAACDMAAALGLRHKRLAVSHAFHSEAMTPILAAFEREVAAFGLSAPRLTLISNLTGAPAAPEAVTTPAYWSRQIRRPVQFEASMRSAQALGVTHFLEIGPAPVLLGMGARFVPLAADRWLPSLRPGCDDWTVLLDSLQALYVAGVDIDWAAFDADYPRQRVALPTYPFQRRRHWLDLPAAAADDPLHAWRSMAAALDRQAAQGPIGVDLSGYEQRWQHLERLTVAAIAATLRDAGCFVVAGDRASAESVRERLGAATTYRHLLRRWLERLAGAGLLRRDGDTFAAEAPLPDPKLEKHLEAVALQLHDNGPLLDYMRHCCALLPAVVGGRESALETLFPNGSFELAEALYERSAPARYVNGLAAAAVESLVAARPGHAWRVLEAGAGTGGTTTALLPVLPAGATYRFTDITDVFVERARTRFAADRRLSFATFDLEDAAPQGAADGSFDLVVAANAVHAVRDLRQALLRLRRLLAPGGVLLLVESTRQLAWFDITTGLIEGWQSFDDDLRTDQPLLAPAQWLEALRDAGFADAGTWPPAGSQADAIGQHVVLARIDATPGAAPLASPDTPDQQASPRPSNAAVAPDLKSWRLRLQDLLPVERIETLRGLVRDRVMAILRLDADQSPGPDDRLMDLGFDSLMAVQLRGQLGDALGLDKPLPATLLFDHPTIAAMAEFLLDRLAFDDDTGGAEEDPAQTPETAGADTRVAELVAMSDAEVEVMLLERLERR